MTGKRDETGAVGNWLDAVFQTLKTLTDEAIAVTAAAGPPGDVAEAEKRARAIGVIARTAKVVAALKSAPRKARDPEEDGMREDDHDIIDDAEDQRLRAELESRIDHLCGIVERKGFGHRLGPPGQPEPAEGPDGDRAESGRRPGLAA